MTREGNTWLSPADIDIYNENDQLIATIETSDAEIYPQNRTIKAANIPIQYDSENNTYYAETTYNRPVTKAKFEFDMANSVLPNPTLAINQLVLGNSSETSGTTLYANDTNTWTEIDIVLNPSTTITIPAYAALLFVYKRQDNYIISYFCNNKNTTSNLDLSTIISSNPQSNIFYYINQMSSGSFDQNWVHVYANTKKVLKFVDSPDNDNVFRTVYLDGSTFSWILLD